jgi:hypothetical protein
MSVTLAKAESIDQRTGTIFGHIAFTQLVD